ncbi:MAG: hypothetical protein LKCHEGNO_01146 [Burkholderiaceae bacterium]|nr:hypothetical protein [Burkholderiaceae bacterium]
MNQAQRAARVRTLHEARAVGIDHARAPGPAPGLTQDRCGHLDRTPSAVCKLPQG